MAEASKDAILLISTSWQALQRLKEGNEQTQLCDKTIALLFAAFFIEANINFIVEELNLNKDMEKFFINRKYPGLKDKIFWFYNKFNAKNKVKDICKLDKKSTAKRINRKFRGFNKIYSFRNNIAHGRINKKIANTENIEALRQQAKDIVDQLFLIIKKAGFEVKRNVTYQQAIIS